MSWISRALVAMALVTPLPAMALNDAGAAQYDQCVLQTLRESRNSAAASLLQNACDKLYRNAAMLLPRERAYYACLVDALPGVRDNFAVQQIVTVCSRRGEM
ncbi:VF_A0006 family four-cysteine protein [Burkholderia sp. TSV86]|uniref:VF_A0006 family four-cysteine protein n=1 Tax=Burkholderia sp. TSV86 TaxID=1385594 RepID=UPI000754D029|nr:VF_A0006 family four-cysteine protein [Burkholderia sp. TSV86]KVE33578.1 hypothetical protein WS68_12055 [Burkholderia sp. TSV86]